VDLVLALLPLGARSASEDSSILNQDDCNLSGRYSSIVDQASSFSSSSAAAEEVAISYPSISSGPPI
jgi:hypothetical protein